MRATLAATAALLTITPTLSAEVPLVWEEVRAAYLALVESGQPGPDEAENGWPVLSELMLEAREHNASAYEAVAAVIEQLAELDEALKWDGPEWPNDCWSSDVPDVVRAEARAQLDRITRSGFFDRLDAALAHRRFVIEAPAFTPTGDHLRDDLLWRYSADWARVINAFLLSAITDRDAASAAEAVDRYLSLTRAVSLQSMAIQGLIISSTRGILRHALLSALEPGAVDPAVLRALVEAMNKAPELPHHSRTFEGERYHFRFHLIKMMHYSEGRRQTTGLTIARAAVALGMLSHTDAEIDRVVAASRMPRPDRAQHALDDHSISTDDAGNHTALKIMEGSATELAAAHLLLAIELHRLERGALPDSLDGLVPGYLTALPTDIFADDERFRYRVTDPDQTTIGRGYLLYSVGHDGVDNDGAAAPTTWDALMGRAPGKDAVFNTWLER